VTGKLLPVDKTAYDFRKAKPINKDGDPAVGYDQSFVVDNVGTGPAAEAWSEKSGIQLQIFTTEPIVHLYTGGGLPIITGKGWKAAMVLIPDSAWKHRFIRMRSISHHSLIQY